MPRSCGPCSDKRRNEIDQSLLKMEITHETYRTVSLDFGYSVDALKRHKTNHLIVDLADVHTILEDTRERVLEEIRDREMEETKQNIQLQAQDSMVGRLEAAQSFLDQLKEIRNKAAHLLDSAEEAKDLKAAGTFLKELREVIRLWAELEGRLASQPQITIINHPEWVELRSLILTALDPYPQAKMEVVNAIRGR